MTRNAKLLTALAACAVGLIVVVTLIATLGGDDADGGPDTPIDGTPGNDYIVPPGLHAARLDLAARLSVDPRDIRLVSIRHAGWNGCFGVIPPSGICNELFAAGTIAVFEAGGRTYRYHIAGNRITATDFLEGRIDDGTPLPPDMMPDTAGMLSEYLRADLALLLPADLSRVRVESSRDVQWPDGCIGVYHRGAVCTQAIVDGWLAILRVEGESRQYRYHGVRGNGFIAVWSLDPSEVRIGDPLQP